MSFLRSLAGGLGAALALAACAQRAPQAPSGTAAHSAPAVEAPPAVAAPAAAPATPAVPAAPGAAQSRIYIDPVTGEMRTPSMAELAADAARRRQSGAAAVKVAPDVVVTPLPGGITEYDLGGAAQVEETACLQRDGSLGECTVAQKAALRSAPKPKPERK